MNQFTVLLMILACGGELFAEARSGAGPLREAKLGVHIYSRSRVVNFLDTEEIVSVDLSTPDPPKSVIKFYESELKTKSDSTGMIMARKGERLYLVSAARAGRKTLVWIMGQR